MKKWVVISVLLILVWNLIPNQVKINQSEVYRCTIANELCD